jgi:broad specificity phosphatase PhoE
MLVCRHPETVGNVERRYVGAGDTPLTERGRTQAEALTSAIVAFAPSEILSSPRDRASAVASAAGRQLGMPVRIEEDLREIGFGKAEGLTYDEAQAAGLVLDSFGGPVDAAPPQLAGQLSATLSSGQPFEGGESWGDFAERVTRLYAGLVAVAVPMVPMVPTELAQPAEPAIPPRRIAVVTHGGVFRAMLCAALELPREAAWRFAIPPATTAVLVSVDGFAVLDRFACSR